jgi:hypothetical protein
MRTIALIRKSLVIIASLAALTALGGPAPASATGTSVSPSPLSIWVVQGTGTWSNSGVTLKSDIGSFQTSIPISHNDVLFPDMPVLAVDTLVKVDNEYMLIEELIDGGDQPDTMVVTRAQNGSSPAGHWNGTAVKAPTVTADVYANDVTDPLGLGSFEIHMVLPPEVRLVQMIPQQTWLDSTGRSPWGCDGPHFMWDTTWVVSCTTLYDHPNGPTGSGLIAKVTLLPSHSVERTNTIRFTGSTLVNSHAQPIPATVHNLVIKVLKCPDANLDGYVNVGDALLVALQSDDEGRDSGATLVSQVNASQTQMEISDQSLLPLSATASIDAEQISVQALHDGTPDTMTVVRAINRTPAKPHNAGAHIYLGTLDGNGDGKFGYTGPRDVNHDGRINVGDSLIIASIPDSFECPAP